MDDMYGVSVVVNPSPAQPSAISLRDADQWHTVFGGGRESAAGVKVTPKKALGYPPFWRGVNLLANDVAALPLDVFRRDGDDREVAQLHPAQRLLKEDASSVMSAFKFKQTLEAQALVYGNGFAWIERGTAERPIGLWPLDPQSVLIRYMDDELWYCTTINGESKKFPGRDVLHISGLTHNGITGYSALDLFHESLGLGIAAQQFGAKFFGQGANMGGLLMVPGHFDEAKIRNTLSAWSEMSQGLQQSHKVALLQDGVKFQPLTVAPEAGQFTETRDYEVRATVANILGVPPHLLGDASRTSHNSLEQEAVSYLDHSLNPRLATWEAECRRKLLTAREQERRTHFIEFNREAKARMLFREKVEGLYREIEMGLLTVNEGRKMLNMPGIGEDGDKRYHPANWMEVGEKPEPPPAAPPVVPDEDDPNDDTTTVTDDATNILRSVITVAVDEAVRFEQRKVRTAASKQSNFCGWLDGFYDDWITTTVTGFATPEAQQVKRLHATESKRQLLDVAGSSTVTTLPANVTELVDTWGDRTHILTAHLMELI